MSGRSVFAKSAVFIFVLGLMVVATGCAGTQQDGSATTQAMDHGQQPTESDKVPRGPKDPEGPVIRYQEDDLKNVLFDFDKSNLRDDQMAVLRSNLDWIKRNENLDIELEGHADERGSNAYNLALGERRSDSVYDYLVQNGVDPNRLFPTSKGEEDLAVPNATTEAEHQKNRRVVFWVLER